VWFEGVNPRTSAKLPATYERSLFLTDFPCQKGRLWPFHFREVATSVHFPSLIGTFDTLEVIEVFPDEGGVLP